ncbi:uncharacterized protein LOC111696856 [Eurytemora carolleeae]|uniref:uncharacterized protein LOC111696856 n=1 Tax=Eurytemora carolleeae TaxID=1294199 RepID=UPI000C785AF3|nr:uncharacterized protein LOC111696856 [Eurytemora carolleeae]|eukprot:XP_023322372.1 uncharacterized protein LOC111696856 [Eurytemora affinis]
MKNLCQILTVLSFISLSAAELTCESCRNIGKLLSEELASESSIQGQLDEFRNETCSEVAKKFNYTECSVEMTFLWPPIAQAIFEAEEGYFRPSLFCNQCPAEVEEDESSTETTLAPEDSETTTTALFIKEDITPPYCDDCIEFVDSIPTYFDDAVITGDFIHALQYEGFCTQFRHKEESCRERVAYTFPRVMRILKNIPVGNSHVTFCERIVKCINQD